jgi:hypothetical protein
LVLFSSWLDFAEDGYGMCHGWQLFEPMLEEGMASIEQAARFVQAQEGSK